MKCKIKNNSSLDLGSMLPLLKSFLPFAQERMGFSHPPSLEFLSDSENSSLPLGKTAHYSPSDSKICIFVDKRHPKDIMRSLSHELVHHKQNCNGKFNSDMDMGEGYAQSSAHLREMEKEAYLEGNMMMRDWEDKYKKVLQETIYYETFKGDTKMSIIETKRARFNNLLMERWGYKAPGKEELTLQESELDEAHCGGVHEDEEEELEEGAKPDFLDLDKDGDKEEPMKAATKGAKELDEGAIEDAERAAQQAINNAKSEIASASSPPPVQNTDNMGADMTDPMEEDALRKKIREVLRNSFNAKS
jgi:hypothetical protein